MASSDTLEFDALRREATKLERHLEDRVAKYQQVRMNVVSQFPLSVGRDISNLNPMHCPKSQLAQRLTNPTNSTSTATQDFSHASSLSASLEEEESHLSSDIQRTIAAMSALLQKMSLAAEKTGRSQHLLLVKRYREILFDCTTDYKKTSSCVARRRDTLELFEGRRSSDMDAAENGDMDQLLRERNAIGNSIRNTSLILGQAEEIKSDLRMQGSSLKGVHGLVARIAANVPGINHLIDSIRRKRNRDDWILTGVISACVLFTLWYVFAA